MTFSKLLDAQRPARKDMMPTGKNKGALGGLGGIQEEGPKPEGRLLPGAGIAWDC